MMPYRSQYGEDAWLYANGLNYPNGTFVEVGAGDGITFSNTYFFEKQLNWRGLLIEPDPRNVGKIKGRTASVLNYAITLDANRRFHLNQDPYYSGFLSQGPSYSPKVATLEELCLANGLPQIDLLSIDTEGTELEVWQSRGKIKVKYLIIEYLTYGLPSNETNILNTVGNAYTLIHKTETNLILKGK